MITTPITPENAASVEVKARTHSEKIFNPASFMSEINWMIDVIINNGPTMRGGEQTMSFLDECQHGDEYGVNGTTADAAAFLREIVTV